MDRGALRAIVYGAAKSIGYDLATKQQSYIYVRLTVFNKVYSLYIFIYNSLVPVSTMYCFFLEGQHS